MATYNEGKYPGDWLKFEAPNDYSREQIVILAGSGAARALTSGMVLAKITKGVAAGAVVAGGTGNGTITAAPTVGAAAKVGVYRLTCIAAVTNGGIFMVQDPDGIQLPNAVVGTEYTTHLTFTIADGSTDFAAGDSFTITVAAGSGKWVQLDDTNTTTGIHVPAGILFIDASAADGTDGAGVAIVRDAVINTDQIVWPAGADANEKAAALAVLKSLGIVAREGV